MAQRKRFTRVEMARVLMERNQYKERFMELQEAVRWTEMLRASKTDTPFEKHSNKSIWRFFSNLFTSNDRVQRPLVVPHLRYQTATNQVAPGIKALPRLGHDLMETEIGSEKLALRKALERREQYRQVRAHVRKEDGRLQAYGWSLPGKVSTGSSGKQSSGGVPVPVPVYCRPLAETTPEMRIWCAAGVNLMGGHTKDGGLMVGGSVFYSDDSKVPSPVHPQSEIETLDQELNNGKEGALLETRLSSLVWICTTTQSASIVTVIDANNPAELLNSFGVCANHILCIASVPGASLGDYHQTVTKIECNSEIVVSKDSGSGTEKADTSASVDKANSDDHNLNGKCSEDCKADSSDMPKEDTLNQDAANNLGFTKQSTRSQEEQEEAAGLGRVTFVEKDETVVNKKDKYAKQEQTCDNNNKDKLNETCTTCDTTPDTSRLEESESPGSAENASTPEEEPQETQNQEIMSSVLATMWMGDENGNIYVHSSVANWAQCLHTVKMKDAVIAIVHINGRVVVALACGQVAIFRRHEEGEWDLSKYHLVQIGLPHQSVRQLAVVGDKVWCGYRNKIHVLQPHDLKIIHTLEAHPRRESPVRQMAWLGEGVWVSIRLDSTLRLYHAHTYQHLQDVDIEPYVSKMLGTGKLGFSLVRITSLLISSNRLWIGTSNGVIISVPLSDGCSSLGAVVPRGSTLSGFGVRILPIPGSFVPYCTMAHAQLSFHGHRDNVKFFVAVPGNGGMSAASTPSEAMSASVSSIGNSLKQPSAMLVISGGEGYVDFRIEDDSEPRDGASHLLVWQLLSDIPGNPIG
ncbi:hypothetical protein JTB14_005949 [Gonioctena quinquepunctata]|nr:hypothetical protein JTB14_005949 [Gonioctena quinquepunctata]